MLIYYAHPIDQAGGGDDPFYWLPEALGARGAVIYDPAAAWRVPALNQPRPGLQKANLDVLRQCDGLIACLRRDVMSVGVVLEIVEAINHDIPTLVYAPGMSTSWALAYLGAEITDDHMRVWSWLEGIN